MSDCYPAPPYYHSHLSHRNSMERASSEKHETQHVETAATNPATENVEYLDEKGDTAHIDAVDHNAAGQAVIDQQTAIPLTGERIPTSKLEYITFAIFCESASQTKLKADIRLPEQWNTDWLTGGAAQAEAAVHGLSRQQQEGDHPLGRYEDVP